MCSSTSFLLIGDEFKVLMASTVVHSKYPLLLFMSLLQGMYSVKDNSHLDDNCCCIVMQKVISKVNCYSIVVFIVL